MPILKCSHTIHLVCFALTVGAAPLTVACSGCGKKPSPTLSTASAPASRSAPSASAQPRTRTGTWPTPLGPSFAVLPGKGIGPIRIGATVATIERHMQAKCEEVTASLCRYPARGVDFELDNGVVKAIHIQGPWRRTGGVAPDGTPRTFGTFNGVILPDLMLGMTPQAIQEHLGPPKSVQKARADASGAELVHVYDGLILEYDRIPETGLLALGSIEVVK